jgi:hypothetical protein
METGSRQYLSHADLAHGGAEHLQLPDEISHEVRELVHRLGGLDQRSLALLVQLSHPRAQGLLVDEKRSGCLLGGPVACCLELQDAHPLNRRVERTTARPQPAPASILDIQFLPQQSDLGRGLVELALQAVDFAETGGSPAPGESQGGGGECHAMEQGRLDVLGPTSRQRYSMPGTSGSHRGLREIGSRD